MRRNGAIALLCVVVLLAACSSGGVGANEETLAQDAWESWSDTLPVEQVSDQGEGELDRESTDGFVDLADAVEAVTCATEKECSELLCVTWPGGSQCTRACGTGCGAGEECRVVAAVAGAESGACIPRFFSQCAPCDHAADCREDLLLNGQSAGSSVACVVMGAQGSFCAAACSVGACEAGFDCVETELAGGGTGYYCVPQSGVCGCGAYAAAAGTQTECLLENDYGACTGSRGCVEVGSVWELEACQGEVAQMEACNNEDDDCDGEVDEGWAGVACETSNELGSCPGVEGCVDGKVVCSAPEPAGESCDGQDNDCDGETDEEDSAGCIEYYYDDDGDGVGLAMTKCLCAPLPPYSALSEGDCNDYAAEVVPNGPELCDNIDNNCTLTVDEGCDDDQDGWCDGAMGLVGLPQVCAKGGGDCNDDSAQVYPGQTEICDGVDNGCGGTDVGCDDDQDGWCDENMLYVAGAALCQAGGGDCDDQNGAKNPGNGTCVECSVGQQQVSTEGCGSCQGRVRVCVAEDVWGEYSECQGLCDASEYCVNGLCKSCLSGMKEYSTEGCAPCSQKKRVCGASGDWGDWGSCIALCAEGELCYENACVTCLPGTAPEVTSSGCSPIGCQKRSRTCLSTGQWSDWGACATSCPGTQVCNVNTCVDCRPTDPAQSSSEGCDACSTKQRYCTAQYTWGAWSQCLSNCPPTQLCWDGLCVECTPYTSEEAPCGCGSSIRYCLPNGTWGPYSDCETFCAMGFQCDNGIDCYVTFTPQHAYEGQAWCGWGEEDGQQVSLFCQAGEFCIGGVCRVYQYKNQGTQYTPYPTAGGTQCGSVTPDLVTYPVYCLPGDVCMGSSYCVRQ